MVCIQRGYRDRAGQAPIKETLAAAIVMRSGWQPGTPLLDPMWVPARC